MATFSLSFLLLGVILLSLAMISSASASVSASVECMAYSHYPRQYVAPKLSEKQTIKMDGKLDDEAWQEVPFSEEFVDIQGNDRVPQPPYFSTRMKMRWDDKYLYVGGYLEETQTWANQTRNNSIIYHDNDFEIFLDPDGSNHKYKEFEINAANVQWNLLMVKPYLNGGPSVCNFSEDASQCARSCPDYGIPSWDITNDVHTATYINGQINNPIIGSVFWSVEIAFPLEAATRYENSTHASPLKNELWRINFMRAQWHIEIIKLPDGRLIYSKQVGKPGENWVWQAQKAVNMHLPEMFGYVQFAYSVNESQPIKDPTWPQRYALMGVYNALKMYVTRYGKLTTNLQVLQEDACLSSDIVSQACGRISIVPLSPSPSFRVDVYPQPQPQSGQTLSVGHVLDDRFLWFSSS
eukprot:TRINITY_DN2592_c0_g1_i1.p1 TRINITY_DN2592_c0_g1~~TRINITY_DN2592_c0_g1_i1.p1  ORF type:complete len:409 (+),score=84.31 TRINITY_DN2592_c0_g1_i1:131-1357(+)